MNCQKCGAIVEENQRFCPSCGAPNAPVQLAAANDGMFCTNCGMPVSKKGRCQNCGYKTAKNAHKFCRYCGTAIGEAKCSVCPACNMRSRPYVIESILRVICFVFVWISFIGSLIELLSGDILSFFICLLVPLTLCIFVIGKRSVYKIKKALARRSINPLFFVLIYLMVPLIVVLGMVVPAKIKTNDAIARTVATEYAHEQLRNLNFKNPESLQINNTVIENEFDNELYYYYKITIDYSAQNGFGGYNRDVYEVLIKVRKTDNEAFPLDYEEYINEYRAYVEQLT